MADRPLADCRILVVEDEYMLADDLAIELRDAGAEILGPAGSVDQAIAIIEAAPSIDGALLDVNLGGVPVFPVADLLAARGVPFLFTTGYDADAIPARYASAIRCEKPVSTARVRDMIGNVMRASG